MYEHHIVEKILIESENLRSSINSFKQKVSDSILRGWYLSEEQVSLFQEDLRVAETAIYQLQDEIFSHILGVSLTGEDINDHPICYSSISEKIIRILLEKGYDTVGIIRKLTKEDILSIPGIGPKGLEEIEINLASFGVFLKR